MSSNQRNSRVSGSHAIPVHPHLSLSLIRPQQRDPEHEHTRVSADLGRKHAWFQDVSSLCPGVDL